MLKYCKVERTITIKLPDPNCFHALHNSYKRYIGKRFGVETCTVADIAYVLRDLVAWQNTNKKYKCNEEISKAINLSNKCKQTTVIFKNYSLYTPYSLFLATIMAIPTDFFVIPMIETPMSFICYVLLHMIFSCVLALVLLCGRVWRLTLYLENLNRTKENSLIHENEKNEMFKKYDHKIE